jgi:hypothetical protein
MYNNEEKTRKPVSKAAQTYKATDHIKQLSKPNDHKYQSIHKRPGLLIPCT